MIYTPLTKRALALSFEKHKDQKDKSGMPYVYHPYEVASSMEDEISVCVALLHDVVEDTDTTFDDLKGMGFPDEVLSPLRLLTHADGVDYLEYVKKIKEDPVARKVKLADLKHNSDPTRLDEIPPRLKEKFKVYAAAIELLSQ